MNKRSFGTTLVVTLYVCVFLGVAVTAGPAYAQGTAKVFELKWSTQWAPNSAEAQATKAFADLITKRTDGKVKISIFHAETLGKIRDFLEMLDKGICDIVTIIPPMYGGQFEMMGLFDLPMLGIVSRPIAAEVAWELFYAGNLKEFDKFKVLAFTGSDDFAILLRKKKVTKMEDLKGLKIRTPNPYAGSLVAAFGAVAVSMPASEVYMAMDRGVIDGYVSGSTSLVSRKMYEVGKSLIASPRLNAGIIPMLMNKRVWSSLPPDVQLGVEEAMNEFKYVQLRNYEDDDKAFVDIMKKNKVEIINLGPNEVTKMKKASEPIISKFAADRDAKGQPGKKSIDMVRNALGRYPF